MLVAVMIELEMRVLGDILSKARVTNNPTANTKIKARRPSVVKDESIPKANQMPTPKNTERIVIPSNFRKGFAKSRCAFDFSRSELISCSTLSIFGVNV